MSSKTNQPVSKKVPFEKIVVDEKFNSRAKYDGIEELAQSILSNGLLQDPSVVEHNVDEFFLVFGFRRYMAIKHIRENLDPDLFNEVPVKLLPKQKKTDLQLKNLSENLDRENLSPAETAEYIVTLTNAGLDQRSIAKKLGRPQSWVSYHYKVATKLTDDTWDAFTKGELTLENALYIADVDEDEQVEVFEKMQEADTRAAKAKIAKTASKEKGTRRKYKNKGRPTRKTIAEYVDEISFNSTSNEISEEEKAFWNGVAAGARIAIGDKDTDDVTPEDEFFDVDFSGAAKAAREKEERRKAKAAAKAAKKAE